MPKRQRPPRGRAVPARRRTTPPLWPLVFAAAFILRLLYLWSIRGAYFFTHLQVNPLRYHQWATLILDRHAPPPPFEQSPGFPYLMAAVYALFGRSVMPVALVQAIIGAATCAWIAVLAERWWGRRVGLVAGALASLYGPFLYFTGELVPETAFGGIVLAALACACGRDARAPRWGWAGWLWGLAIVFRSNAVLALPVVLADAWIRGGSRALQRAAAPIVVTLAALLALNVAVGHRLVLLTTSGGENLWLGNNPHADGVSPFVSGPLEAIADDVRARATDAADADQLFRRHAVAFWTSDPKHAVRLLWKKLVWTLNDRELPNNSDIEWKTGHSWLFHRPLFPPSFGMIVPLAIAGTVLLGAEWRRTLLLLAPIAIGLGTGAIFFTNARFRLIMVPSLILLAALALDRAPALVRDWPRRRTVLASAALGAIVAAVLAWGNFYGVRAYRIAEIEVNTGALEREAGNLPSAVAHLRAGLAGNPRDAIGWIHLALALEQQGQVRGALQAYLDALGRVPADASLRQMAARFFSRYDLSVDDLEAYVNAVGEAERLRLAESLLRSVAP